MDHNKKYNKQIELFYDYDDYQVDIYSVLDSIKEFKSTGICINRTNFIVSYHKIYDFNKVDVPIQIFSGSPKSYHRKSLNINEITNLNLLKETHNIILFIHSIYIINLSREINDNKLIINYLQKEFEIGKSMNSKGIVFHVGKQVNLSKELALNTMKSNILDILDLATENTPFILETPAGQGTELLTTYQEFSDFYSDIMSYNIAKNRFKICIDTCHVFAAGVDPYKYIENWIFDYGKETIALIHFNDSCGKFGCKKDRHKTPGEGFIGSNMKNIYNLCLEHNLYLVYE